jgi:hypothetical protein
VEPLIISASRRTDIPALYAEWFIRRVRAGYCTVANPYNRSQVSRISLLPEDVAAVVFWSRNPRPLLPYLAELDERGMRYYFHYTLMDNPREVDAHGPSLRVSLRTFRQLAQHVGPQRVIWRYDPILLSETTSPEFHLRRFAAIAAQLEGLTRRCVISLVDDYRKTRTRMAALCATPGFRIDSYRPYRHEPMLREMLAVASARGMQVSSCAEEQGFTHLGISHGRCIDAGYIRDTFDVAVTQAKDRSQRLACGCVASRDIGAYDSCILGCRYCYATSSSARALANYRRHDVDAPALLADADAAAARSW